MFDGNQVSRESAYKMKKGSFRFYYGWVILVVSFFTLLLALGVRLSFGVFYMAILSEYGWGRGETAGAFSIAMLSHAIFAPVSGDLLDRFGPRTFFPLGATFLVIGLVAASRITAIWHLYLFFGVVISIGVNTIGFGPHVALIPKWFIRRRGLASGLALSGVGMGAMVVAPLSEYIIEALGWRFAFLILAGIIFVVVVPATALLQRRSPEEVGQYPDGIDPGSEGMPFPQIKGSLDDPQSSIPPEKWTFKAAMCTRSFWWLGLAVFTHGIFYNMLVVHQAVYVVDSGYSQILAASLVGLVGLIGSAGGIICGFLSDRFGREIGYTLGSSAAFIGILLFFFIGDTRSQWMLYGFVILYGLGHGSLGPIYASKMGDLFPGASLGRIMAPLSVEFGLGGAIGAYVGGYFYDQMGTYFVPFLLLLVSIFMGALGIWRAVPVTKGPAIKRL